MKLPNGFELRDNRIRIDLPGTAVAFTTRRGGFSHGPYATLNLGRLTDDDPDSVERNRAAVAGELGVELRFGRQVHGAHVNRIDSRAAPDGAPRQADGQATALNGVGTMALVADCLPIAIAAPGAVGMLHGGWRGLAAGVIDEGVRAIRELGGEGAIEAAIGPGAGPCCYEVGEEVHAVFTDHLPEARHGNNLDLKAIARSELVKAGVEVVHDVGLCTICSDPGLFYSHRRDRGVTGRQAGIAWLT